MNTPTPSTEPTATSTDRATVVLVDPTSPDGETSLDALHDADRHVLIVVLTSGRACNALRNRAHDQGVSVTSAAWSYLEEVALRVSRSGRVVGTIVASGPDAAYELISVVAEHPCERIVLPASTARIDRMLPRRLTRQTPVVVETAAFASA
ncbi:hypothetical protein BDK89_3051 [Ilumatobacter fluminis]|uniref:Universal stress protein family protein n=1 Tax=Ilumatobacter fluminis TaxID=467091 RepID=A0A4R7I1R5_9ACTN|nr:hypothetical protein [Ilumatobacter fluminis]TDT17441.1 hypothetical protein BDK89_3051 [Ilumatobacter fluminis]